LIRWRVVPRDRIEVVYAGPGVEPLPTASDYGSEYSPFVLYVGGYGPNKNTDRLLDAFARLQIESRTKLVMVGWRTPSLLAQAVSAVRRHALTDRVVLLSNELTDTHLSALYQRCLMFVYPSLYEGFGLPVLEALAHGAPVVCSSSSSLPEIVGDSALCFDPRSTEDMARQMQRLADSPRLRAELGRRGKTRADGFSWKLVAQGVHAIARSTLQKGRG
jgi:glycosyltransferase involved in cell wall biosynthesis